MHIVALVIICLSGHHSCSLSSLKHLKITSNFFSAW